MCTGSGACVPAQHTPDTRSKRGRERARGYDGRHLARGLAAASNNNTPRYPHITRQSLWSMLGAVVVSPHPAPCSLGSPRAAMPRLLSLTSRIVVAWTGRGQDRRAAHL